MQVNSPIENNSFESSSLKGKSVLITGATGTIGSEILRQVLAQQPKVVRVFSRDETKQAMLRLTIPADSPVRFLIGDVRDLERLRTALVGVEVVYHAAALKHVPACEYNPYEAVQTNVIGTQNLIQACRENRVKRLVYVSTDKAVNPANTMGATKLLAENMIRASQEWNPDICMCAVRFGNVMGSRGSLLPLMVSQMEQNGRVELTSPEMTRFMMTISDACKLVLRAGEQAVGGELYILKMPSLRVKDLVEVFVQQYSEQRGWPEGQIEINQTGPRPGEKIHEQLLTLEETTRLEEHDDLFVVQPSWKKATSPLATELPAACDSGRSQHLSAPEIIELLERSGAEAIIAQSQKHDDFAPA